MPIAPIMILALGMALGSAVHAQPISDTDQEAPSIIDKDAETVPLPMNRLLISEKDGRIKIISDNGRYLFRGNIRDTWDRKDIQSIEDARESARRMNLDGADLDLSPLKPIRYGDTEGKPDLTAFIRPTGRYSNQFLDALKKTDLSADLIVYDAPGLPEATLIGSACPVDESSAVEKIVNRRSLNTVNYTEGCDPTVMNIRNVTKYLLGYEDFPIVVRSDYEVYSGFMDNVDEWRQFLTEEGSP